MSVCFKESIAGIPIVTYKIKTKPDWNHKKGLLVGYDRTSLRYIVALNVTITMKMIKLKEENLLFLIQKEPNTPNHLQCCYTLPQTSQYNLAITHDQQGHQYHNQAQYDLALTELHKSLEIKQNILLKKDIGLEITKLLLANVYLKMNQFDNAIKYWKQATKVHETADSLKCMNDIRGAMKRTCVVCFRDCKKICRGCKKYWFCCKKHQKIHWKRQHRFDCDHETK